MRLYAAVQWGRDGRDKIGPLGVFQLRTIEYLEEGKGRKGTNGRKKKGVGNGKVNGKMVDEIISGSKKVTQQQPAQIARLSWSSTCGEEKGHELCGQLKLADIDPALTAGVGNLVVNTPLQALLATFLLRNGTMASLTAARNFVEAIVIAPARMELCIFSGKRGDHIPTGRIPSEEDQFEALTKWMETCLESRSALAATGFGAVAMEAPVGMDTLAEGERSMWEQILAESAWSLERVRAVVIHKATALIAHPRVVIGDSSGHHLARFMDQTICIGPTEGSLTGESLEETFWSPNDRILHTPLPELIRTFKKTVLSTKVRAAVVIMGRDSLLAGETVTSIMEQMNMMADLFRRFPHVSFFWTCPPYVHAKQTEFEELIVNLHPLISEAPFQGAAVTETGRSALELFRFGDTFNEHTVCPNGQMKDAGVRSLRAWLFTQVPGFPGDSELGIRTIRSEVHVAGQGSSGGPGDLRRTGNFNGQGSSGGPGDLRQTSGFGGQRTSGGPGDPVVIVSFAVGRSEVVRCVTSHIMDTAIPAAMPAACHRTVITARISPVPAEPVPPADAARPRSVEPHLYGTAVSVPFS